MTIDLPESSFPPSCRILDAGGWFQPCPRATHVVDLMPYETRRARLSLEPQPGEYFSKATWQQADFMAPSFRLPYPDKFFDLSLCGHTLEDLPDPAGLLAELNRVSRAGYIETPSRISEQTIGVRDRMGESQGHPHHHWIVEAEGARLVFSPKTASLAGPLRLHGVPLRHFESRVARDPDVPFLRFRWAGDLHWKFLPDDEAARRARELVATLQVGSGDRALDAVVRRLRWLRYRAFRPALSAPSVWWQEMLALSRPYSAIPL